MATPKIEYCDGEVWMDKFGRRIQIVHRECPDWPLMVEVRLAGESGSSYLSPAATETLLDYKIGG